MERIEQSFITRVIILQFLKSIISIKVINYLPKNENVPRKGQIFQIFSDYGVKMTWQFLKRVQFSFEPIPHK